MITSDAPSAGQEQGTWPSVLLGAGAVNFPLHLLLVACIIIATGLRVWQLGAQSFWYDEIESIRYASNLALQDVHPPTYYLILHALLQFSQSEFVLRLPTVIAGVLSVVMVYAIGQRLFSIETALVATLLASVSPFLIWHSQDARMYSLLVMACLFAVYFYVGVLQQGRKWNWIGYFIAALFALHIHLYAGLMIITLNLHYLLFNRQHLVRWFGLHGLLLLFYSPWLVVLFSLPVKQIGTSRPASLLVVPYSYFTFSNGYSFGPSVNNLRGLDLSVLTPHLPLIIPLAVTVGVLLLAGVRYQWRLNRQTCVLILLWAFLPVLIAALVPYMRRTMTFNVRYILFAAPAFLFILALGVAALKRYRIGLALLAVLLLFNAISIYNLFYDTRYAKEDVRSAAEHVAANASPDDHILVVTVARGFDWYFDPDNLILSNGSAADSLDLILENAAAGTKRLWLVQARVWQTDPNRSVEGSLTSQYPLVSKHDFVGVEVFEYCIADCPPTSENL